MRYRLTPNARENVDEICAFIADESIDASLRVLNTLEHAFLELADMPGIGHTRKDLTNRPVKFWNVHSFLVVYDPSTAPITIVAVLHGARDVARVLASLD